MRDEEQELIDEERQRLYEIRRERARASAIARDPFYPPQWAAEEFDNIFDPEV